MSTRLLCRDCQRELHVDRATRIGGTAERGECEGCGRRCRLDEFPAADDDAGGWSPESERARYGGGFQAEDDTDG